MPYAKIKAIGAGVVAGKLCPDCAVKPGEEHIPGCDVERCPNCGRQAISCGCPDEEFEKWPKILWTGEWPGVVECREFGWFAKFTPGKGWIVCGKDDPEAKEDLNRLLQKAKWSPEEARFIPVKIE
jgi:hypothetical protein